MTEGKNSIADDILRAGFERWQRLEGEKQAISDDLKELFSELKGQGFDGKALRAAFRTVAKADDMDAQEHNAIVDLYVGSILGPRAEEVGTINATRRRAAREENSNRDNSVVATLRANPNLAIVEAAALVKSTPKNSNTNSQRPSSANDLTGDVSSSLGAGQVPQIQESQANATDGSAGDPADDAVPDGVASRASVGAGTDATNQPETAIEPTAEGNQPLRSGGAEAARLAHNQEVAGASPAPATKPSPGVAADKTEGAPAPSAPRYAAPGVVTWESSPPEGVERSPYSMAFGIMGQDTAVIADDLEKGRAQPIVKMGRVIIDGWARYMSARDMRELDGSPVAYPVVQYDGQDPLIDVIKLNVDGRLLNEQQKRLIAATLARIEPKRKADIFKAFELFVEPV